jgi:hypothetical protein
MGEGQGWGCALNVGVKDAFGRERPTQIERHHLREHPHPNPSPIEGERLILTSDALKTDCPVQSKV